MEQHRCNVGHCGRLATRLLEVRRTPGEEHPAEVRPVCESPTCMKLAMGSAAGFHRTTVALEEGSRRTPEEVARLRRRFSRLAARYPRK